MTHFRNRRCLAIRRRRLGRAYCAQARGGSLLLTFQIGRRGSRRQHPLQDRPPTLQVFRSVLSRTRSVSTHGFHGFRSYLRRHGVQFRRAHISYHKTAFAVYLKIAANRLRKQALDNGFAGPVPNHFKTYPHLHSRAKRGRRTTQLKISAPSTPQREISTAD